MCDTEHATGSLVRFSMMFGRSNLLYTNVDQSKECKRVENDEDIVQNKRLTCVGLITRLFFPFFYELKLEDIV